MSHAPTDSTKRKRAESHSSDLAPVQRSKIWMPYGDIILQAESTQFRLNRDILARQSSVFEDMFSIPQPAFEPTIEGCLIVHVSDTAKDWESFLAVLYHPDPFRSVASRPYTVVASMLRLGKKYDMCSPKEDSLRRIYGEFPAFFELPDSSDKGWTMIDYEDNIYAQMLNLACECGLNSAIPRLGLACLQNLPRRWSGTLVTLAFALERILEFQRERLDWLHGNAIIPHKSCKSPTACVKEQKAISYAIACREEYPFHVGYTISEWDEEWDDRFCAACEAAAMESYDASQQKGWELLPTFFGLPPWEDLKDAV
ncbi:hypothetical protein C8F04DRAFT_959565 [Mycena alexandri]|uniref:BTB domain-containing protein n=1 Tax=Mycena alexandri TaxID=1745969 RepID=A0AAD6SQ04_9AGAR|nr:hypothetical protein C8F04DRAFT_959565 [Mycena alexandri]